MAFTFGREEKFSMWLRERPRLFLDWEYTHLPHPTRFTQQIYKPLMVSLTSVDPLASSSPVHNVIVRPWLSYP